MARTKQSRPARVVLRAGPFGVVGDATDPGQSTPTALFDAVNMLVPDPASGSAVVARHGFGGLATQLGTGADRTGQGGFVHRRLDGVVDRIVFAGGKMYRWDGLSTLTDITPSGIVIDSAAPVFCASFADQLIVTDSENVPWRYDPATSTATLIDYDGLGIVWCAQGPPAVYSGKLFFILKRAGASTLITEASDTLTTEGSDVLVTELLSGLQNTIIWSEEYLPQTGYQQTNYDNAWQLTQTSADALTCLVAEEGALIYFRAQAIGAITGAVNADFRSAATRDTISTTVGTMAPAAVKMVNRTIWFPDIDGKVHRLVVGSGAPEPLWYPMRRVVESKVGTSANRATVRSVARVGYHEAPELLLFTLWDRTTLYVIDARTGSYLGTWSVGAGIHVDALGALVDSSDRSCFALLGSIGATRDTTTTGYLWRQKFSDDTNQWLDQTDLTVASYTALTRAVEPGMLATDPVQTVRLDQVTAQVLGGSVAHTVKLQHWTPAAGLSTAQSATSTATTGEMSGTDTVSRVAYGMSPDAQGSVFRLRLTWDHSDNVQAGLHALAATGVVQPAGPWTY